MTPPTLGDLSAAGDFARRHIGPNEADIRVMLAALGQSSLAALM